MCTNAMMMAGKKPMLRGALQAGRGAHSNGEWLSALVCCSARCSLVFFQSPLTATEILYRGRWSPFRWSSFLCQKQYPPFSYFLFCSPNPTRLQPHWTTLYSNWWLKAKAAPSKKDDVTCASCTCNDDVVLC